MIKELSVFRFFTEEGKRKEIPGEILHLGVQKCFITEIKTTTEESRILQS